VRPGKVERREEESSRPSSHGLGPLAAQLANSGFSFSFLFYKYFVSELAKAGWNFEWWDKEL
jgi:hypothetical protein